MYLFLDSTVLNDHKFRAASIHSQINVTPQSVHLLHQSCMCVCA
jgi:hypothetical protein